MLVNKLLDEVRQRLSHEHYMDTVYHPRRWSSRWKDLRCSEISIEMVTQLRNDCSKLSNQTANKELRHLKALFNWGIQNSYTLTNPASKVEMMRVEKKSNLFQLRERLIKYSMLLTMISRDKASKLILTTPIPGDDILDIKGSDEAVETIKNIKD